MKPNTKDLIILLEDISDDLYFFEEFFGKYFVIINKIENVYDLMNFLNLFTQLVSSGLITIYYGNFKLNKEFKLKDRADFKLLDFNNIIVFCNLYEEELKNKVEWFIETYDGLGSR